MVVEMRFWYTKSLTKTMGKTRMKYVIGFSVRYRRESIKYLLKITKKCVTNWNIYFIMKSLVQRDFDLWKLYYKQIFCRFGFSKYVIWAKGGGPMSDGNKINLLQMQKYFEGQMERIRTISDLELSENDFKSLGVKLRSLCFFTGSENDIEDFMLSISFSFWTSNFSLFSVSTTLFSISLFISKHLLTFPVL